MHAAPVCGCWKSFRKETSNVKREDARAIALSLETYEAWGSSRAPKIQKRHKVTYKYEIRREVDGA